MHFAIAFCIVHWFYIMATEEQQTNQSTSQPEPSSPNNTDATTIKRAPPQQPQPPSTKRHKAEHVNTVLSFAAAEDKGHRNTLEDVWIAQPDARPPDSNSATRLAVCGVFDGHAGRNAAEFVSTRLNDAVAPALLAACTHSGLPDARVKLDTKAARAAIVKGFADADAALLDTAREQGWVDGATAVVAWVLDETVLVANIGDAKAVLARAPDPSSQPPRDGQPDPSSQPPRDGQQQAVNAVQPKAIVLTKEHKAMHRGEMDRIVKARGRVVNGRLDGRLEVSRAFGDPDFKSKGLSCVPDVTAFTILPGRDKFLLLACDGYFTVVSPQDAVDQASKLLHEGHDAKGVCVRLLHEAVRVRRCKDNCTVLMCMFKGGEE